MLHVTNGDVFAARLRAAGRDDVLPWRELLHEGPVPAGPGLNARRAAFLASHARTTPAALEAEMDARDARVRSAGELTLWLETDLFDQLIGLHVLSLTDAPAALVPAEPGELDPAAGAVPLEAAQRAVAREAWAAFRAPDPTALEALVATGTPVLPALAAALRRHLEQFPWITDGLTRSERALLRAVADGARTREAAFLAAQAQEERPFLGDATAFAHLDRLAPLAGGEALALTPLGEQVLAGETAWDQRPDMWLGGVQVGGWRWDPRTEALSRLRDPG